jgi:UDP-glucose 4-epimerase
MIVVVTGAAGYVGRLVVSALAQREGVTVVATDVRPPPPVAGVDNRTLDIRDPSLADLLEEVGAEVVVHLAAVVRRPKGMTRETLHAIEVGGTQNLVDACVRAGVRQLITTSSGAAYGYHADNAPLLFEDAPLRGNETFAYACHKRQAEAVLERARADHPELGQLIFRVSTILGSSVDSPITRYFESPVIVGLRREASPFCFAWDGDVVAAIVLGVTEGRCGVFNLTGDGVMTLREIAQGMGRRFVGVPKRVLTKGLSALHSRGWIEHSPERIAFLQHRPVLSNRRLKEEFGFTPSMTSREVFAQYRESRAG